MLLRLIAVAAVLTNTALATNLATVNGKHITDTEFKSAIENLGPQGAMIKSNPMAQEQFLDHLVNSKLISAEAIKNKVDKDPAFTKKLETVKNQLLSQFYMDQYVNKKQTDKELKAFFNKNKSMFSDKQVRASHILFKTEDKKKAEKILAESMKKGADFAALAKKHSTGPSASNGGDLNFFGRGQMVPAFEKAAFKTKKGTVYPKLVETQFGHHIIKVTDHKGSDKADYKKSKTKVSQIFKRDLEKNLVETLRKKAGVKVQKENLKKIKF